MNAPRTTHTQTYIHTQTYVHTQTYIHTNTHIHTHKTYIHTQNIHTYIHRGEPTRCTHTQGVQPLHVGNDTPMRGVAPA